MTALLQPAAVDPAAVSPPGVAATGAPVRCDPNPARSARLRLVGAALLIASGLATAFLLQMFVLSGIQQARTQNVLAKDFRLALSQALAPVGGAVPPGAPVAVLDVPGLSLRQVVVEGTTAGDLIVGPGHRRDTVLPGQAGVSAIFGRRTTYGGPFSGIDKLLPGDPFTLTTGQGAVSYEVERLRRDRDPLPPPLEVGAARLVLATADPPLWPTKPVFVDARQTSPVQPTPTGRIRAVGHEEDLVQGDPAAVLPLALWAQVLAVCVLGYTWARVRLGRRQAYLIGTPIILAVLWNVAENAVRLLPNVL